MNEEKHEQHWLPRFEAGETLTANELNRLVEWTALTDRFQARNFQGHGVIHGLEGSLDPDQRELVISPGWATGASGERMIVEGEIRVRLCPLEQESELKHPDVVMPDDLQAAARNTANFTPVLCSRVEHYAGRSRTVYDVKCVPGRVRSDVPPAYENLKPLEGMADLRAPAHFRLAFTDLVTAVETEMERVDGKIEKDPIRASSRIQLKEVLGSLSTSIEGGVPSGGDLLKIAALNDAVYTLWQRARAKQYIDQRESGHSFSKFAATPNGVADGVPLGWLYKDANGGWRWDGRWRSGLTLSLSRLRLLGYDPVAIRHLCSERIDGLGRALKHLLGSNSEQPFESIGDRWPLAWCMSPEDCESGVVAWLREVRLDRPQRLAVFWPLDPLRGSRLSPVSVAPSRRFDHDPRVEQPPLERVHPAPSIVDPVNDPFQFCGYQNTERVDAGRKGLIALAGLIGFPPARVWGAIARCESAIGDSIRLAPKPISIKDDVKCEGKEFVMVATYGERLTLVTDGAEEPRVIGFARDTRARAQLGDSSPSTPQSFWSWLFSR